MRDYFRKKRPIHFIFPIDGDCLNEYDGSIQDGIFMIKTLVQADEKADLYINDRKAVFNGSCFEAEIPLYGYRNTLTATGRNRLETEESIAVYHLKNAVGKYRISVDDIIVVMQDLTVHKERYTSVFDHPFLRIFKEAHDTYGLKISLNLFYETDEMPLFYKKHDYFNLSMMTDAYKEEWKRNSDWLAFAFHAKREYPDYPYRITTIEEIRRDCEQVHQEILRFAGKECLSDVLTIHWGMINEAGLRTLRTLGYKSALGYFILDEKQEPFDAYYYPADMTEHIGSRDFWKDNEEDMMFVRIDVVLNELSLKDVPAKLDMVRKQPHRGGFFEMVIHEQYFYEDYTNYIPDYGNIILESCRWLNSQGYQSCFLQEVMNEPS